MPELVDVEVSYLSPPPSILDISYLIILFSSWLSSRFILSDLFNHYLSSPFEALDKGEYACWTVIDLIYSVSLVSSEPVETPPEALLLLSPARTSSCLLDLWSRDLFDGDYETGGHCLSAQDEVGYSVS